VVESHISAFIMCVGGESTSFFMDWDILGQLSIHFVESVYLFYTVAATMDWLLQNEWILPYESND
jgi:hypothetical protein